MSGRAGRRGIDDRGIVILMVDEKISPSVGKQIVKVRYQDLWTLNVTIHRLHVYRDTLLVLQKKGLIMLWFLLLQGQADPLNSAFHLTYNMVLNLLRVEEINPEYMLERSFYQFQNYASIPELCESKWFRVMG